MEKLHTDIAENILCRLPIETALQAKRVCKTWRILLRGKTDKVGWLFSYYSYYHQRDHTKNKLYYGDQYDHIRGKMNRNYTYDALDKMDRDKSILEYRYIDGMLGSCNGLVCFQKHYMHPGEPFRICNPITGEVTYAPETNRCSQISGFGYCHSMKEYKIVRMCAQENAGNGYHVQVYTVGTDEWRNKELIHISPLHTAGIYANGTLHWMHRGRYDNQHHQVYYTIVALDLEDEKFQFIPLTRFEGVKYSSHFPKLLSGNNLYFVYTFCDKHYGTDIWAYKRRNTNTTNGNDMIKNYNDKNLWHWVKEFSIEWEERYWKDLLYFEPLALTSNNELLLCYYCCDLKTSTLNKLVDACATGDPYTMINVIPHANSIVSMHV